MLAVLALGIPRADLHSPGDQGELISLMLKTRVVCIPKPNGQARPISITSESFVLVERELASRRAAAMAAAAEATTAAAAAATAEAEPTDEAEELD